MVVWTNLSTSPLHHWNDGKFSLIPGKEERMPSRNKELWRISKKKKAVQIRFTRVKRTRSPKEQVEATKKVRVYPEKPQFEGKYIERARTLPRTAGLVGSSTPLHGWTALYWLLMMVNSLLATWEGPEVRCGEFWEGSKLETEAPSAFTVIMKERNTFVERGSLPVRVLHGQSPQSE